MAKAPFVIPRVKSLIAKLYQGEPGLGPTAIHKKLLARMKEEGLDRNFGPNWPGVSTVSKVLKEIREEESRLSLDREDRPWSVAALADYDIPPEALLIVMKAWAKALEQDGPLTIREVKWIARLYCVYPHLPDLTKVSHFNDIAFEPEDVVTIKAPDVENEILDDIIRRVRGYANEERAIKLTGTYPHNPQDAVWLWWKDASLYLDVTGDKRPLENCGRLLKSLQLKLLKKSKGG